MNHIFFELTAVLVIAAITGSVAQAMRLPTILGYLVTGVIVGPLGVLHLNSAETLDGLAQVGIASLLFLVGMEMRIDQIRAYGKAALLTGLGQILFTSVIGFFLVRLLGFGVVPAVYIAVALTFSSTIIVIKLLSEKHALESHSGKLIVGFLLVQDFVALGFLILLSSLQAGAPDLAHLPFAETGFAFVKGAVLLVAALGLGKYVLPHVLGWAAKSPELLFLASLAWGMGLAAFAASPAMGLTIEIGAFMAGVAMAGSFERYHVSSRVKPLRDFFIVLFFVVLGSKLAVGDLRQVGLPAVLLSLFVLIGNPLLMLLIMGSLGYKSRVSFLASVTVGQISEFSLILVALGHRLGHVGQEAVTLVTTVGIITIALSSYLILHAERLYVRFRHGLRFFEFRRHKVATGAAAAARKGHIVLVGCHRIGHNILHTLESSHDNFVVVDIDPEIVESLLRRDIAAVYGDITDPEVQEAADLEKARLVISTIPDTHVARHILRIVKDSRSRAKVILAAPTEHDAAMYYREGADYVMLPHFTTGRHIGQVIEKDKTLRSLASMRRHDSALIDASF